MDLSTSRVLGGSCGMWLWLGAPEARHRVSPRGHSKTLSLEMSWQGLYG